MPTEFQQHCEIIEQSYEFTLSYAAQGHGPQDVSPQGQQLRDHLTRAVKAMRALEASSAAAVAGEHLQPAAPYDSFLKVLVRDAQDSIAAIELVLAQPSISSQLIDNLNASIHLRALLTDLFLFVEILEAHQAQAAASQHVVG
jgi:hypothetical protein